MATVRWLDPKEVEDDDGGMALEGEGPADHFTRMPHVVLRRLMAELGCAEFKVLCFLVDRIYGYSEHLATASDTVSCRQIRFGVTGRDGRLITAGTHLSRSAVWEALADLERRGLVARTRRTRANGATAIPTIRVILPHDEVVQNLDQGSPKSGPPQSKIQTPGGPKSGREGVHKMDPRQ